MKISLVLFLVALGVGLICGDEKAPKAKDAPEPSSSTENVICKKCNCDAESKIIECSNKSLTKMFSLEDWVALNATKDDYEVLKLDHNQIEEVDVQFPALRFPLKVISFRNNKIKQVIGKVFINLDYIEEIDFSFNELEAKSFKPNVFEGKYNAAEFQPLLTLKRLRLSYNLLNNLDNEIFEHTKHL